MAALNAGLNLFWLLLGAGIAWQSVLLGLSGPGGPGSGLFPLIAGAMIAAPGVAMLVAQAVRGGGAAMRGEELTPRFWMLQGAALRVALMIAVCTGMIAGIPYLGFAVTGAIGIPLLFRTVEPDSPWWFAILVGLGAAAAVHLIFAVALGTPLPRGPWGF